MVPRLLLKIRMFLPQAYYRILETYLTDNLFQVKFKDELTTSRDAEAGVAHGIVLGTVLYVMCTSDLPSRKDTTSTFSNETAILATHEYPAITSMKLQATTKNRRFGEVMENYLLAY
jgi:hypothetical protein